MKRQKILHLFNEANDSKFVTSKWNIVNYHSNADYNAANEITHNTHKFLKYNLCHYNDVYILLRRGITIPARDVATEKAFKNCVLFTKYITKTNETTIDDAGNLDLVKPMYNLIAYSSEYSETTGILWFY